MSTTVTAPVAPADMTTAQLSDRMSKLAERHDALKANVSEFETVKADLAGTLAELQKRLGTVPAAAPAKPKAKAAAKPRAPRQNGDGKAASLKDVVLAILEKNPDGLDLGGIRAEVEAMKARGEYHSNAQVLSAVISQAVNGLKQEGAIIRDSESKKYSKVA